MKSIKYSLLYIAFFLSNNAYPNAMLHFLYNNPVGKTIRPAFTGSLISNTAGWYADTYLSRKHINGFIKAYNIPMEEAERTSVDEYSSFNDFFIRTLKPNARPIDNGKDVVCSPADGQLLVIDNYSPEELFTIKNVPFNLEKFLGNSELAQKFTGGTILVIYLAPWNYHRFHFPLDCNATSPMPINGKYESVHPIAYQAGIQPLTENERVLILLNTDDKEVACVAVGALCVGRISMTYNSNELQKKGDEMGYFSFGGSTIVLVFQKDVLQIDPTFNNGNFHAIKMGQRIGLVNSVNQ